MPTDTVIVLFCNRAVVLERLLKRVEAAGPRRVHQGCASAVSGALGLLLAWEASRIVLGDNCLPDPSLFGFCSELLERYRNDPQVLSINGTSFDSRWRERGTPRSYRITHQSGLWGLGIVVAQMIPLPAAAGAGNCAFTPSTMVAA